MNAQNILPAFKSIFVGAFSPEAVMGGAIGISIKEAVRFGVARGLFSNEAGMGSTPHAHAMAKVAKPQDQGAVAMVGVFIDTFIVLTMTALVILTSGMLGTTGADGQMLTATALAQAAFNNSFGSFGNIFVAVCLFFFAFSTILSWNFFGKVNAEYLFGKKGVKVYTVVAVIFIFAGSLFSNGFVWELTDFFNYLMVLPNVLALAFLSVMVAASAKTRGACDLPKIEGDATVEAE
jgi:AGCS family alanine or glycine:cation symporter